MTFVDRAVNGWEWSLHATLHRLIKRTSMLLLRNTGCAGKKELK